MLRGKKLFVAFMFFVIATTAPGISEAQNTRLLSMLSCPGLAPLGIDLSDYIPTNSGDGICWCYCRFTGDGLVWMCEPGGCNPKDGTNCSDARIPPTDIGRDILINELASIFKQFPDIPINWSKQCILTNWAPSPSGSGGLFGSGGLSGSGSLLGSGGLSGTQIIQPLSQEEVTCTCEGTSWTPPGCTIPRGETCPSQDEVTCYCFGSTWGPSGCVVPRDRNCPASK